MAWELIIHMIDVGHGDSTLIMAVNSDSGQSRTMLIDAGPARKAERVHRYVSEYLRRAGGLPLDHIVVTNYGLERYPGVEGLLRADNLHRLTTEMGAAAANEAAQGVTADEQLAGGAAAARAVSMGAYALPGGLPGAAAAAGVVANSARIGVANRPAHLSAEAYGVTEAENTVPPAAVNPPVGISPALAGDVAEVAARKAEFELSDSGYPNGFPLPPTLAGIRTAVQERINEWLRRIMPMGSRFDTGGAYTQTHVIDIGPEGSDDPTRARLIETASAGQIVSHEPGAIGVPRQLTRPPTLGSEILWNSGPHAMRAPAGAPQVFVMAEGRRLWQRSGGRIGLPSWQPGQPADVSRIEQESIALIVRFGDFLHLDAGDLPSRGAELIAKTVTQKLVDPVQGEPFPAGGIASIKCGYRGANACTSASLLEMTGPSVALISCGEQDLLRHPSPSKEVIDRLKAEILVDNVYLTNCRVPLPGVAVVGAGGLGDKGVVSGSNGVTVNGRVISGDVALAVEEADLPKSFSVHYLDTYGNPVFGRFFFA